MKDKKLVSVVIVSRDRKKDLTECIESYLNSSYKNIEVIVVDNASRQPISDWVRKKYPKVKIITSDSNLGAAEGRNMGLDVSKGDYIIFTDDDAYADKNMTRYLVEAFEKKNDAGIIQPLVYDKQEKSTLQGAGHDIDLTTGRIKAWGVKEEDQGQYEGLREVPMCGCVWMVKREVFNKIGDYDKEYFIPYEDSDFSIRARKAGYKLYCYSLAKSWHQGVKKTYIHPWIEWLGITSSIRAYRVARNKIIFMAKHSEYPSNVLFFSIFLPIYIISHSLIIIAAGKFQLLSYYLKGVFSGLTYLLKKIFNSLTLLILAWSDPLPWVIDRSAKSILDIGCGEGLPMRLIKKRMKVESSTGVDLFEPYIKKARNIQTHGSYELQDIRKLNYGRESFDVVIASHVLEHLPKEEALMVLEKLERIAKKQIIIAAPIGEMYHPEVDGNKLQLHLSEFEPEEFEKRNYRIIRYGWKWLLGEKGLINKYPNIFIRKLIFIIHLLSTPLFYIFTDIGTYTFVAYKTKPKKENHDLLVDKPSRLKIFLMSLTDPLPHVVDKTARSILDLGSGQGKPMAMIKFWRKIEKAVGVELYRPYIDQAKQLGLYDQYLLEDVRKINFPPKSFDIVMASHVLEHLSQKEGWVLLSRMEKIAKKQVIIATPIGEIYQPMFDKNILQEHKSYFLPEQFIKRGYKVIKYGARWILDEHSNSLVYQARNPYLKKLVYIFNYLITPLYYFFPEICDYSFVAYKNMTDES